MVLQQFPTFAEQLILLAIEDITVRKGAERLRQETEDRLHALVDSELDSIITIDEQGTINSVNGATERMFGYSPAELVGQNVSAIMPDPYHDEHDGYLARYLATDEKHVIGVGREVLGQRKNGTVFPVDLAISEFFDGGQRMFSGVLRDLTARKELEQEVLDTAAAEQQRIGQELHDTSAQELTALRLLADSLVSVVKDESPAATAIATKMAEGLKRVLGQVRAFSRGLIRVELDERGLMAALSELAEETAGLHRVTCTFECARPVSFASNQAARQLYTHRARGRDELLETC